MRTRCTAPDHRDVLWQKVSDNADDDSADVAGAWVVRMQGTMTICMRTAECPRPLPIAYWVQLARNAPDCSATVDVVGVRTR